MPDMEIGQALSHIKEIRQALVGTQIYRGHRPITVAATGLIAVVAACLIDPLVFSPALSWLAVGVVSFLVVGGEMAHDYYYSFGSTQQRLARQVLNQFLPPLGAGAAATYAILHGDLSPTLLPALWAAFFGMSLFAARPYLGRGVGWVALFYTVAGISLFSPAGQATGFTAMGLVFGFGQLFLALILQWNLPRETMGGAQ